MDETSQCITVKHTCTHHACNPTHTHTHTHSHSQGHEHYNPQKKNYIFMRQVTEEMKPRSKKR